MFGRIERYTAGFRETDQRPLSRKRRSLFGRSTTGVALAGFFAVAIPAGGYWFLNSEVPDRRPVPTVPTPTIEPYPEDGHTPPDILPFMNVPVITTGIERPRPDAPISVKATKKDIDEGNEINPYDGRVFSQR